MSYRRVQFAWEHTFGPTRRGNLIRSDNVLLTFPHPSDPMNGRPLSSKSVCFRDNANKQMRPEWSLFVCFCVAPHVFHSYVAPDSRARFGPRQRGIQVNMQGRCEGSVSTSRQSSWHSRFYSSQIKN